MLRHWILELPELAALSRTELSTVKSWMSRSEDIFRPSYGRTVIHRPRQCVFIATSNEGEPLKDTTGNRRFWPVEVGRIDTDALVADKDQLWAEAVELYRAGVAWWLKDERVIKAAQKTQARRLDLPVWYDAVSRYCLDRDTVTVTEILSQGMRKELDRQTQADKNNVVKCLQAMGWRLTWRRLQGRGTRVYVRPDDEPSSPFASEEDDD
jgi:predicted P-loop ATPase